MKRTLLSLALAAGFALAPLPAPAGTPALLPLQASSIAAPDPAEHVRELAQLFRAGDLTGLAEALLPPDSWDMARSAYELHKLQPISDEERAEFEQQLQRFTAPDAVDQLMAEIEPKLEEARPQAPGALLMGFGALQMAISSPESELTEEQRAALAGALPGLQAWASSTDFLSSDVMRQALTLVTDAARRTGLADVDQIRSLSLEGVLDRAATVFVAAKQAVRLYGIDLDLVADSLQVEVLSREGDTARVRTTITLFDAPVFADHDLVLVDGRWYGKHAVIRFDDARHDHDHDQDHKG